MGKIRTLRGNVHYEESSSKVKEDFAVKHPSGRSIVTAIESALSRRPTENACWLKEETYYRVFIPDKEPPVRIEFVYDLHDFPKSNVKYLKWHAATSTHAAQIALVIWAFFSRSLQRSVLYAPRCIF
ncbi:MAG: hypothetical protein IJU76_16010 [Desulfovibrionaceae bacterium]|nr:hypothetical protein [Desulfovibrionaceae bacterium]